MGKKGKDKIYTRFEPKIGDNLIIWNFEETTICIPFLSIDKIISYDKIFQSNYIMVFEDKLKWEKDDDIPEECNMCYLEDYLNNTSNYPQLKYKEEELKLLIKEFFNKYKVEGRKYKFEKLWK
jgi:hypothetical protein